MAKKKKTEPPKPDPEEVQADDIKAQEDADAYLNALKTKDEDVRKVAHLLKQEEAELAQMRQDVREKNKGVLALRKRLVDMGEALPGQTSIDLNADDDGGDPARDTAYDAGYRAFGKGEIEDDNPYPEALEQSRKKWFDGFAQAAVDAEKPYRENRRDLDELQADLDAINADHCLDMSTAEKGKPVPVVPLVRWLTQFLVYEPHIEGACAMLVPIYPLDTWKTTYAEMYGERWAYQDRGKEAPNQIDHGEHCGLIVRVGRKQHVIGSIVDAIHIMTQEAPQDEDAAATADDAEAEAPEEGGEE